MLYIHIYPEKKKKIQKVHFSKLPPVSQKTRFPIHPVIYIYIQIDRQIYRQIDIQIDRYTDRQIYRQIDIKITAIELDVIVIDKNGYHISGKHYERNTKFNQKQFAIQLDQITS